MTDSPPNPERSPDPSAPAPAFTAASQRSYSNDLFLGPDGLRPGWGLAFYVFAFFLLQSLADALTASISVGSNGLWSMLLQECCSFLAALIPAIILVRVERRPWKSYGLPVSKAFGKLFWLGAIWGFASISLLMLALYGVHVFSFGHILLHGVRLVRLAAFWGAMFLVVGFFEEFLMRGYTQFTLARGLGFWPAAVALSCTFGLIHLRNSQEQWRGLLAAACIGLFFCLTLRRTGSLWFAIGFHTLWDWGESYFYSVPDSGTLTPGHLMRSSLHGSDWLSGGSVGPEGSVLCFVVIAALWIAFDRVYPQAASASDARSGGTTTSP